MMGDFSPVGGYKLVPGRGSGRIDVQNCRREKQKKEEEFSKRRGETRGEKFEKKGSLEDCWEVLEEKSLEILRKIKGILWKFLRGK